MQTIGEIANKHTYKNKKGEEKQMDINVIPNYMEKYMAFMLGKHLVFINSFQFMSSSLHKLVSNLPDDAFKYTSEQIKKVYTLMTTWIHLIGLMKQNYQLKMTSVAY